MTRLALSAHPLLRHSAAVLVLSFVILLGAPAAQAHDVLDTSSPANGATVQTVPASVALTFDHTPIGVGTEILVKDPTGANQADGPAKIVDTNVTQPVKSGAPAGTYTVVWRVVSADSHPIEGTFTFTANAAASASRATTSSADSPADTRGPATSTPSTAGTTAGPQAPVWLIVAAAAVIALAALALFVRRALARGPKE